MKTLLYTLIFVTGLGSCRTLEKMVERGQYDEAIVYATEKLAGKKNKKTKHVQGLEEAFYRIQQQDLELIAHLNGPEYPHNWERILSISENMHVRQEKLIPFLPLISKDGYQAQFDMQDTYALMEEARVGRYHHALNDAEETLAHAVANEDKHLAREAYHKLMNVKGMTGPATKLDDHISAAEELGTVHIQVNVQNVSDAVLPSEVENHLESIDLLRADSKWRIHYHEIPSGVTPDYHATLELGHMDVSPERESITYHTDSRRIKDGWRYKVNPQGEYVRDTLGNRIKEDTYRKVYAEVTEIQRTKSAQMQGRLILKDGLGQVIATERLSAIRKFNDWASSYTGDRRALCDKGHAKMKTHPLPYPDDLDLIMDASDNLKGDFMDALYDIRV